MSTYSNSKKYESITLSEVPCVAYELLQKLQGMQHWALEGDLGTGKTTLIQELCKQLGVTEPVTSPTYGLIHPYQGKGGIEVAHFDLYRIKTDSELPEIGFFHYLETATYCFIEWPQHALPYLSLPYAHITIEPLSQQKRRVICTRVAPSF